jgi:hypothetical protein
MPELDFVRLLVLYTRTERPTGLLRRSLIASLPAQDGRCAALSGDATRERSLHL